MVLELTSMGMEILTKGNGRKIKSKDRGSFSILMETVILGDLLKEENRVTEFINGPMGINMKAILREI